MKVAILAGGMGVRLQEVAVNVPKPMVKVGGKPVLHHIMNHCAKYNLKDFTIALGFKGDYIKRYFIDYCNYEGHLEIDLHKRSISNLSDELPKWKIRLIETGLETQTGGRIKRLQPFLGKETFLLTWGDIISDVVLDDLIDFHRSHGKLATLTAVNVPERFGVLQMDGNKVTQFVEKPLNRDRWINGAYFVLEPKIFDYIKDDSDSWEEGALSTLAQEGELMAYYHDSLWQCMDTPKDKMILESLWQERGFFS